MGHDDDRPALLRAQFLQQPANPLTGDRVEAAGRLVGQQHRRFRNDGPGNGHALLFAAAEGVGRMAEPIGHFEPREQIVEPGARGLAPSVGQEGQKDVVPGGERGNQVEGLEDQSDVAAAKDRPSPVGHGRQVVAGDEDPAGVRPGQAGDHVEQGALARSAGPHHGHELARRDREADVLQGVDDRIALPELLGHVLDDDREGGRCCGRADVGHFRV